MVTKRTILIIEDDPKIKALIAQALQSHGYGILEAANAQAGINTFFRDNPDIVLLDLGLPDSNGIEVIRKIRAESQVPIIVVSARLDDRDKVLAFDEGADDYLTKPFSIDEFLARIRMHTRKLNVQMVYTNSIENGPMTINLDAQSVSIHGHNLSLTPSEYKLIEILGKNMGKVMSYDALLVEVWGHYGNSKEGLRVFVTTLRKKLESCDPTTRYIKTHIGVGYQMIHLG